MKTMTAEWRKYGATPLKQHLATAVRAVARLNRWKGVLVSTVSYPHIETSSDGVAIVAGTTTKVVEIVQDYLAHHWHAEDIQRQHPYLSLAQIHAALAYYYDHQQEIEQDIDRRLRRVAEVKGRRADETNYNKLRQLGHVP